MRDQWVKVILFANSCPLQGRAAAELQSGSASHAGDKEGCFHGSNGAAEKSFDALAETAFNLKEKVFLVRTDASLPLGQGLVVVSDAA